jgi:hypothetical protein
LLIRTIEAADVAKEKLAASGKQDIVTRTIDPLAECADLLLNAFPNGFTHGIDLETKQAGITQGIHNARQMPEPLMRASMMTSAALHLLRNHHEGQIPVGTYGHDIANAEMYVNHVCKQFERSLNLRNAKEALGLFEKANQADDKLQLFTSMTEQQSAFVLDCVAQAKASLEEAIALIEQQNSKPRGRGRA